MEENKSEGASVMEDFMNCCISAKKLAIESKDYKFYEDIMMDIYKDFTAMFAKSTMEAAQNLYADIIRMTQREMDWARKQQKIEEIPF